MGTVIELNASSVQFRDVDFRRSYTLLKTATEEEFCSHSRIKSALSFITDYVGGTPLDKAKLAQWMREAGAKVAGLEEQKENRKKKGFFELPPDDEITLCGMKAALKLFGAIERAEKDMPLSPRTCKMILAEATLQPS